MTYSPDVTLAADAAVTSGDPAETLEAFRDELLALVAAAGTGLVDTGDPPRIRRVLLDAGVPIRIADPFAHHIPQAIRDLPDDAPPLVALARPASVWARVRPMPPHGRR